ncbi:titin [Drosophila nasuta]|uniref:titin n=1 Tax=Drosophila nasuta TaxID=42062 RepID=UPI00295E248A|nr:titin [Drosophila nasuta]
MTSWVFSVLIIPLFVLTVAGQSNASLKDRNTSLNHRNRTHGDLKKQSLHLDYRELSEGSNSRLNQDYYEVRKRRPKKKRQTVHFAKPVHAKRQVQGREEKIYETFEEIHEHINEPSTEDSQTQPSEHYESHEEIMEGVEHVGNKKHETPVKIKVKHHHHHHHHNHIKEVIKTVPKPYKVEKIVHVPVEKIVEKIVQVPRIVNVTVEKIVHVPVEKIIEKVVQIPKPVHVPKPYVVERVMEKIVHVPKPYPVLRTVPYPVEIKVPVQVEKKVPVPYKVEVERKVPVYIHDPEPYKFDHMYTKQLKEKELAQFNPEIAETTSIENYQSFYPPRMPAFYTSHKSSPFKKPEPPQDFEFQTIKQQPIKQHTHIDFPKTTISPSPPSMEQSTSESQVLPVKFMESESQFNIIVTDNNTSIDLPPQMYDNKYHEIPFPFEFIRLQPVPFQSNSNLEVPFPAAPLNNTA